MRDGDIAVVAQEKRFNRKRHDPVFLIQIMDRCLHIVATGCYGGVRQSASAQAQANVWLSVWIQVLSGSGRGCGTSAQIDVRLDSSVGVTK